MAMIRPCKAFVPLPKFLKSFQEVNLLSNMTRELKENIVTARNFDASQGLVVTWFNLTFSGHFCGEQPGCPPVSVLAELNIRNFVTSHVMVMSWFDLDRYQTFALCYICSIWSTLSKSGVGNARTTFLRKSGSAMYLGRIPPDGDFVGIQEHHKKVQKGD
jgi:hypothetical protein